MQTIQLTRAEEMVLLEALLALAYDISWGTEKDVETIEQIIQKIKYSV